MGRFVIHFAALVVSLAIGAPLVLSQPEDISPLPIPASLLILTPPYAGGPVLVHPDFELNRINQINDVEETFEFTGILTLVWKDPRLAFEPTAGVDELVFQGDYQFNEVATGWYPQVVLANESGYFEVSGVVLRVRPDGTSTLIQTIDATAEIELDMRMFPFDSQRLEAKFEMLGFTRDEVRFEASPGAEILGPKNAGRLPQWGISGLSMSIDQGSASYAGGDGESSVFVVGVDVERDSFYIRRLVSFPLAVIVLLSFSVFWMERSSLGDRISVSFIGILTGVSYQLVMSGVLPAVAYFTLMHAFLIISFLTMCGTVLINLWVGALDKHGRFEDGDRIDRRCRWAFPLAYIGVIFTLFALGDRLF